MLNVPPKRPLQSNVLGMVDALCSNPCSLDTNIQQQVQPEFNAELGLANIWWFYKNLEILRLVFQQKAQAFFILPVTVKVTGSMKSATLVT